MDASSFDWLISDSGFMPDPYIESNNCQFISDNFNFSMIQSSSQAVNDLNCLSFPSYVFENTPSITKNVKSKGELPVRFQIANEKAIKLANEKAIKLASAHVIRPIEWLTKETCMYCNKKYATTTNAKTHAKKAHWEEFKRDFL
jgi:hypothetical protein